MKLRRKGQAVTATHYMWPRYDPCSRLVFIEPEPMRFNGIVRQGAGGLDSQRRPEPGDILDCTLLETGDPYIVRFEDTRVVGRDDPRGREGTA